MRKLLALVATMAMVLSMFTGIAFAAGAPYAIRLTANSVVSTGDTIGFYTISGTIVDSNNQVVTTSHNYTITNSAGGVVASGSFANGRISVMISTDVPADEYTIAVDPDNDPDTDNNITKKFYIKYAVTLNAPLNYTYSADMPQVAIMGTVKDAQGLSAGSGWDVELHWLDDNDGANGLIDGGTTNASGQFGFVVDWVKAGRIGLFVNNVLHVTGEVAGLPMTLVATPSSGIVHSVLDSTIEVKLTNGPKPSVGNVAWTVYKGTDNLTADFTISTSKDSVVAPAKTDNNGTQTVYIEGDFSTKGAGVYTIKAAVDNCYTASTTITVVDPTRYTLIDPSSELKEMNIGTTHISFGPGDIELIEVVNGSIVPTQFKYVVYLDGEKELDMVTTGAIEVVGSKLGTKEVKVVAYADYNNDGVFNNKVFEQAYTLKVVGWDVTYTPSTITVGTKNNIVFTVKDENGNPINNAKILIDGNEVANGASTNIVNGVYTAKDVKFDAAQYVDVEVKTQANAAMATFENGLHAIGEKVYAVTSNVAALLQNKAQAVRLTTVENGNTIIPDVVEMQIGDTRTYPAFSVKDTNNDGFGDAIELTIDAAALKDVFLRPQSSNGAKYGEVVVDVVAPKLVVTGNEFVTENMKTLVKFQVIDPRDNSAITADLTVGKTAYLTGVELFDNEKVAVGGLILTGAAEYEIYALATGADYTNAVKNEKTVAITFTVPIDGTDTTVDGSYLVKPATLVSDPEQIILGQATNITLTYTDANGAPIVGKKVYADSREVGTTNENGQVLYAVAQGSTTSLKITAATDVANTYTELLIPAAFDNVAPVVTAPETVDTNKAVITVTDNVRIVRVRINGVEDTGFFPGATYEKTVTLVPGANTFVVEAMDNNYNPVKQTVTITYTAKAVTLQGTSVQRKGENLFVEIRKFEELGAKLTWNGTTKTATFTYGTQTVSVTIGSTTATVNGVAKTMPAAPFLSNGRTLVPTRFISEALGWNVQWQAGDIVTITLP